MYMVKRVGVLLAALALLGLSGCLGPSGKPPIAAFTFHPAQGEAPLRVSSDASLSSDPDGSIAHWKWEFGDGQVDYGEQVEHVYESEGEFTVTLTVTDNQGLSAQTMGVVEVGVSYPLDVLDWELVDVYYGSEVQGRVKNISGRVIAHGRIAVRFYGPTGLFIRERSDYVSDLPPGGEQDFVVTTSLMEHEIGHVEIYTEAVSEDQ